MKYVLPTLILLSMVPNAWGRWANLSLEDLVSDSDFVVVGTLSSVVEFHDVTHDYGRGIITIEEVLWGGLSAGEELVLAWDNHINVICPRVEHRHTQGNRGIWLLKAAPTGHVRADYPGRFVESSQKARILPLLARRSPEAVKQYVQVAPVRDLLNADRPYVHYVSTVLVAVGMLGAGAWCLCSGQRRARRLPRPPPCPHCQSPFMLSWLGLFRWRHRCSGCSRRVALSLGWYWTAVPAVASLVPALGAAYVAGFWTRGYGAVPGGAVAALVSSVLLTKHAWECHGRLKPVKKNGAQSQ